MEGNGNTSSTSLVLVVTFDQLTGNVQVTGPIQNVVICVGMLDMAKKAIQDFAAEQAKNSRIVPAASMPMIQH